MKISGIYKIQSILKPDRIYVGSAVNIRKRWILHLHLLRNNKHHSPILQNHFNKYGESDLVFIIIEPCFPEFLTIRENYYLNPLPYFNVCPVAENMLGYKHTEKAKYLIGESNKRRHIKLGPFHTDEFKQNLSKRNEGNQYALGKKLSEETKQKMRKPKSELHKQHLRDFWELKKLNKICTN